MLGNFDPITGNLWDTENGPGFGNEINFVEPGSIVARIKYKGSGIRNLILSMIILAIYLMISQS